MLSEAIMALVAVGAVCGVLGAAYDPRFAEYLAGLLMARAAALRAARIAWANARRQWREERP